jgi:hypothetical protein
MFLYKKFSKSTIDMAQQSSTCPCKTQQYGQIIFNTVGYQNSANTIYAANASTIQSATNGTLGSAGNGQPIFKTDYARMQYLLGKQNVANCGVRPKVFSLGTN